MTPRIDDESLLKLVKSYNLEIREKDENKFIVDSSTLPIQVRLIIKHHVILMPIAGDNHVVRGWFNSMSLLCLDSLMKNTQCIKLDKDLMILDINNSALLYEDEQPMLVGSSYIQLDADLQIMITGSSYPTYYNITENDRGIELLIEVDKTRTR